MVSPREGAKPPEATQAGNGCEEPASEPGVEAAMAGFRERARVANLTRTGVITEALEAMRDGALPAQMRLQARAAAHAVAGSAGTFGFHEASESARAIEALLGEVIGRSDMANNARLGLEQLSLLLRDLSDPSLEEGPLTGDGSTPRAGDQSCP